MTRCSIGYRRDQSHPAAAVVRHATVRRVGTDGHPDTMSRRKYAHAQVAACLPLPAWSQAAARPRRNRPPSRPRRPRRPLFDDLGDLHRDIGTPVPAAQRYFDQGLRMAYGFNHEAAAARLRRSRTARSALRDACAWGQALVLGPNINLPMDPLLAAARRPHWPRARSRCRPTQHLRTVR
jgi:hypothetical protein